MKRKIFSALLILISACFLSACEESTSSPIQKTDFKLNTVVTITIYDSSDEALLTNCMNICDRYENEFSRTLESSVLYEINEKTNMNQKNQIILSEITNDIFTKSLYYCDLSDGAFDITLEPLTSLWNFTSESPSVPSENAINLAKLNIGYESLILEDSTLTLINKDIRFDLGAIAKGYIADEIKAYLESEGVEHAIINLGGNVLCLGKRIDDSPFQIGIQKPFGAQNETDIVLNINDKSVVSSGIYERYFEENGKLYHHILDPDTGYPVDNNLLQVTIISPKSIDGDALSTACFVLGLEDGLALINSLDDIHAIFMTTDEDVILSDSFPDGLIVE